MRTSKEFFTFLFFNILISLAGCFLIYYATNWGAWGYSDSATYFGAARSLAAGQGLVIQKSSGGIYLFRLFPPFYPMFLSAVSVILGNIFIAARIINIIVFGIYLFVIGYFLFLGTRNILLSLIGPGILLVSPMMIENFSGAMSEPIFFTLLGAFILFEYRYLTKPSTNNLLFLVILLSLLPITRYIGIVFIISNFILMNLFPPDFTRKKIFTSINASLISSLPIACWLLYIFLNTNQIAGRRTQLPRSFADHFIEGINILPDLFQDFLPYAGIHEELLPSAIRFGALFTLFLILIGCSIIFLVKTNKSKKQLTPNDKLLSIVLIHMIFFLFFMPLSYGLTERGYVIDHRVISPLIPMIIAIALLSYSSLISHLNISKKYALFPAMLLAAFLFRFYFFQARTYIINLHENGRGYTLREYQESGIINAIQEIPSDTILISNLSGFVLFHDNRLPQQVDQFHARMYGSGDTSSERIFRTGNAALIILVPEFNNYYGNQAKDLFPSVTEGLEVVYLDQTGGIYYYPN